MTTVEERLAALEDLVRGLRDERDISQLIAAYGPLVDDGDATGVAGLWTEDGGYDVDEMSMSGRTEIEAMVRSDGHQGLIANGCAHFLGPAHVTVDGDTAIATCHSLLVVHRGPRPDEAKPKSRFIVARATAHHFTLVRTADGWRVAQRTSRVLDGRDEAHLLLGNGVRGVR